MIGAGFFFLQGCTSHKEGNYEPAGDARDAAVSDEGGDADLAPETGMDGWSPVDGDATRILETGDPAGIDSYPGGGDGEPATPDTPAAPTFSYFTDLPCGYPASLSAEGAVGAKELITTCGGAPSSLFKMELAPDGKPTSWTQVSEIPQGFPAHHVKLTDGNTVVTHSAPDGFTVIDGANGSILETVIFSDLATFADPDNNPLGFVPTYPGGVALLSGWLCTATSNLDVFDPDPALTTFSPGTLLCFPEGKLNDVQIIETSGKNPTGVATFEDRFVVVSSNTYDPANGGGAFIDLIDPQTFETESIPLGPITAQISPTVAITDGGLAVIGFQGPENGFITVDLVTKEVASNINLPGVTNFISSVALYDHVAVFSDFGAFGASGQALFADTSPGGWTGIPASEVPGNAGPAAIGGGIVYQTVTKADGSGEIVTATMEGMQ